MEDPINRAEGKNKKIVVLFGAYKTIPPVNNEFSGIVELIHRPIEILKDENIKVISFWQEGLDLVTYDRNRYIHIKTSDKSIFRFFPYRLKKSIFGHSDPKRVNYYWKMLLQIWRIRPDTIITHVDPKLARLASFAYPKAEQIFYYHGSILENSFTREEWMEFSSKIQKLIVICDAAKSGLDEKYGPSTVQIKVILNGINPDQLDKGKKIDRQIARAFYRFTEQNTVILYAGRLVKTKGVLELIKGFSTAYSKDQNLRLLIAGDPQKETYGDVNYYYELRKLASLLPDGIISFVGWLSRPELEVFYSAGDVSAVLSTIDGGEGNSLFLMESMAHGLACIATDVGGISQVLDQSGILIPPDQVDKELPNGIIKLTSKNDRMKLGSLARERAGYFTYERVAKELIDFVYQ